MNSQTNVYLGLDILSTKFQCSLQNQDKVEMINKYILTENEKRAENINRNFILIDEEFSFFQSLQKNRKDLYLWIDFDY